MNDYGINSVKQQAINFKNFPRHVGTANAEIILRMAQINVQTPVQLGPGYQKKKQQQQQQQLRTKKKHAS